MSRTHRSRAGSPGLSQREAIVVCALLLVAALVLVPWMLSHATTKKAAVGARNLQQWGIALNLYLIENSSRLPAVGSPDPSPEETDAWYNALPPYLCLPPLAEIPPSKRPRPGDRSPWIDPLARKKRNGGFTFHYGMNRWLHPDPEFDPPRIYETARPQATLFMTEVNGPDPGALPENVAYRRGPRFPSPAATALVLFCDGHVEPASKAVLADDPRATDPEATGFTPTWPPAPGASPPIRRVAE